MNTNPSTCVTIIEREDQVYIELLYWGRAVCGHGSGGKILTTADGITWERQGARVAGATLSCAVCGNGTFVAGGSKGRMVRSDDGVTWEENDSVLSQQRL